MTPVNRVNSHTNGNGHQNGHAHVLALPTHEPPVNIVAERQLLGGLMLDPDAIDEVSAVITPDDFFREAHQTLFRAILSLHDRGLPVEPLAVEEELKQRGDWERFGGDGMLLDLVGAAPHAANVAYHAQIVADKALGRAVLFACDETKADVYRADKPADQIAAAAEHRMFQASQRQRATSTVNAEQGIAEFWQVYRERENGVARGVPTGFTDIDAKLGGCLGNKTLTLVACRPNMGKSDFALNLLDNAASAEVVPLMLSLEMSKLELFERLVSRRAEVPKELLKQPRYLNRLQKAAVAQAASQVAAMPLWIDDTGSWTVSRLASAARRAKARYGVGLVIVDYVQLIEPEPDEARGSSRQEQVAKISRRLKMLAKSLDVPVVALSQLNREVERREDHRPRMSDLRESGALEQDSDVVLMLHRPEYYDENDQPGVAEIIFAKHRSGATGAVKLAYKPAWSRFEDHGPTPALVGEF